MMANMTLNAQLTNLLRDLENTYLDLKAGAKWLGASNESTRPTSVFNITSFDSTDDTTGSDSDEYAISKATSTPVLKRLPFRE